MSVKAKFYVSQIVKSVNPFVAITLLPVTRKDGDNIDWSKFTPSGRVELNVSTETGAAQWFEDRIGKDVAITFDDVD